MQQVHNKTLSLQKKSITQILMIEKNYNNTIGFERK